MVGWYFMHLKFEGNWVYAMLVPAGILAMILTLALIPDVAMQPVTEEKPRGGGIDRRLAPRARTWFRRSSRALNGERRPWTSPIASAS